MPDSPCPARFILEVTFACPVCEAEKPAAEAVRIPRGAFSDPHVDVCRACYGDGVADGIIDPETGDFAPF
jgi:hypothetical protein